MAREWSLQLLPPDDDCLFLFSCLVVRTDIDTDKSAYTYYICMYVYKYIYFLFIQPINNTNLRLSPVYQNTYRHCSVGKNVNILNCATISENCFVLRPAIGFWLFHFVVQASYIYIYVYICTCVHSSFFSLPIPAWPIVLVLKNI